MRVNLITGTSRGIGRFLTEHYLAKGETVVGCSRGTCDLKHSNYKHFELDITDEEKCAPLFRFISKELGRLDHLINNAGIAAMNHMLLTPLTTVHRVLNTNVAGTFLFCREAARIMQRQKYGRMVNFSTVARPLNLEGEAIYAASKAAVESLTAIFARELGSFGVTVNAIGPTPIDTDLIKNVPAEKIDELVKCQAIKRRGTFEDVANVIDFYLSEKSSFISGQVLYLGGI
jgi:3-oxoacyl-[acyl-carrier protein] reductase